MTLSRLVRWDGAALAVLLGAAFTAAQAQTPRRDWTKYPAVVNATAAEDIFAVGDVHGDYGRLVRLLAAAKIIEPQPASPEKANWIGGKATLVFTGDYIDKGPNALGVIALLRTLREAAPRTGGQVIALMGNHEQQFLQTPASDKSADFAGELKAARMDLAEVARCRGGVGEFLCTLPIAARVNDWFFSHAGNTGGRTLERLKTDLESGIDKAGFATPELAGEQSILFARVGANGPGGKNWFEAETPRRNGQQLLGAYAAALGVAHIVEGHAHGETHFGDGAKRPVGAMFQWHGLLFFIDAGMSREINDSGGAILYIPAGPRKSASVICPNGKTTRIWDDLHPEKSGKAGTCRP